MNTKYDARVKEGNTRVCVGLDAEVSKLSSRFTSEEFPQFAFCKWVIDETAEFAAAYKPNSAFFEARGDAGMKELKMVFDYLRESYPTHFTILDAKRADIGNTNEGYVTASFDWLGADSVTLHPYLGKEALAPFLARTDKTSIILCRTSNPGSGEFQDLMVDGEPLWLSVARKVASDWNTNNNCMLVVGATYPDELREVRELIGDMPILIPGIGAQGGDVEKTVTAGKDSHGQGMIINSSRGIIFASKGANFAEAARRETEKLRDTINQYR